MKTYWSEGKYFIQRYIRDGWRYRKRTGLLRFLKDFFHELIFKLRHHKFYYLIKVYPDSLDDISNESASHSVQCETNSTNVLNKTFSKLKEFINPEESIFIDIGSGVGRVIYFAYKNNFKESIGIEQSNKLVEISRENISKYVPIISNHKIKIINGNVIDMDYKSIINNTNDMIVLFLNNPFDEYILEKFISRYLSQIKNTTFIIYTVKQYPDLLMKYGFQIIFEERFKGRFTLESYRIYKQ